MIHSDEIIITRESICGHFRLCGLGWEPYEVDFLKKCWFLVGLCFLMFCSTNGVVLGNVVFVAILKKCEVENDADGI